MATFAEALAEARRQFAAGVDSGKLDRAERIYLRIVEAQGDSTDPAWAAPWYELGVLRLQTGQPQEAAEAIQRAILLDPCAAEKHATLGSAYRMLGRHADSAAAFAEAVRLSDPSPELLNNLALAYKGAKQFDQALAAFDEALRIRPEYANGHFNRANLLTDLGRFPEAQAGYRRSLELNPHDAGAHCCLGNACFELGQLDEALARFDRALELDPNYPEAHRNRASVWLARGDYQRGWREWEWRTLCEDAAKSNFSEPRWDGSPRAGGTVFVRAEQGLGDTLLFIRYVPLVEKLGGPVLLQVQRPLVPLLNQSGFGKWLVASPTEKPFQTQTPLLSLAGLFGDPLGQPYWNGPYLSADPQRIACWRERLQGIEGFRVGVVWAGSAGYMADRYRSTRLAEFAPLAAIPGVRLVSLQKGASAKQVAEVSGSFEVIDLGEDFDRDGGAFMDTAAVMMNLDLIISVDTSASHLAGALGRPVWLALSYSPDWRWLVTGEQTPWYPSMRLFRQTRFDHWPPVFAAMSDALRPLVAAKLG